MLELRHEMLAELPADAPEQKRRIWRQMAVLLASWSDLPLYRDALPDRAPRAGLPLWIYLEYVERLVMPVRYVATAAASDSVQLEVIG